MSPSVQRFSILPLLVVAAIAATASAQDTTTPVTPGRTGIAGGVRYNALVPGQRILKAQYLSSPNRKFLLRYMWDGHLRVMSGGVAQWDCGRGVPNPGRAEMLPNGEFALYDDRDTSPFTPTPYWNAGTAAHPQAFLAIHDDGRLAIYEPCPPSTEPVLLWSSATGLVPIVAGPPSGGIAKGRAGCHAGVRWNGVDQTFYLEPGDERFKSPNGRFSLVFQPNGLLVIKDGNTVTWQAGKELVPPAAGKRVNWQSQMLAIIDSQFKPTWMVLGMPQAQPKPGVVEVATFDSGTLALADDGRLLIVRPDGSRAWSNR